MKKFNKTFIVIVGIVIAFAVFMYIQLIILPVVIIGLTLYVLYKLIFELSGIDKENKGVITRDSTLTNEDEIEDESRTFDDYWERLNMSLDKFKLLSKDEQLKMIARHGWVVREKTYMAEKHEIYRLQKFMVEVVSVSRQAHLIPK